jgi:hypothetical protein
MAPPTSDTVISTVPFTAPVDDFDVVLSAGGADSCHVLIQIDPQDAAHLDLEGSSGAIGRFEADSTNIVLDCKGFQYAGTIHPGPTVLVLTHTSGGGDTATIKVDSMTNEFVTLSQVTNVMQKLNAVMVQGEMDDGYKVVDQNVNVNKKKEAAADLKKEEEPPKKKQRKMSLGKAQPKSEPKKPKQNRAMKP